MNMSNVLLVHEDEDFAAAVSAHLGSSGFNTHWQRRGQPDQLLTLFQDLVQPDVVILDSASEQEGGWHFCRELRQFEDPPYLIFLTKEASEVERIHAYGYGDSILSERGNMAELAAAVRRGQVERIRRRELQQQVVLARSAAFVAMSTSSRIGQVVRFMQSTLNAHSTKEIAESLFEILGSMSLYGLLVFRLNAQPEYLSDRGEPAADEIDALQRVPVSQRLLENGMTLIVQYPHCSLLVRNVPDNDPDVRGQLRDDLCVLVEAMDSRCKGILVEREAERRRNLLQTSLRVLGKIVEETDSFNLEFTAQSSAIIEEMIGGMNREFSVVNINEEDEMRLVALLDIGGGQLSGLFDLKRNRDSIVHEIMHRLLATISVAD